MAIHDNPIELIENFVARYAFQQGLGCAKALAVRNDVIAFRNAFARTNTADLDSIHVGIYIEWCHEQGLTEARLRQLEDLGEAFVRFLAALRTGCEPNANPSPVDPMSEAPVRRRSELLSETGS